MKNIVFFCLKIFFTFTNSVDPDEMQHYAAFHLGLHCLQKYLLGVSPNTKGKAHTENIMFNLYEFLISCCFIKIWVHCADEKVLILISWFHQKPADLDPHLFQKRV